MNINRLACLFLDELPAATKDEADAALQLTNNARICAALRKVSANVETKGLSENVIKSIRSNTSLNPSPDKPIWETLEKVICAFDTQAYPALASLQGEIKAYAALKDDSLNETLTTLFYTDPDKIHFDPGLIGEYIVYRQIKETTSVIKSLLTITAQPSNSAMRFHFTRLDHPFKYLFARGRVLELDKCFTLVGALYGPDGDRRNGLMMSSIAKMDKHIINRDRVEFASGLHSISGDYTDPCSTKLVIVRSDHEAELAANLPDDETGSIRDKAELAGGLEKKTIMTFDDAVYEMKLRTNLDTDFLKFALSNEIKEPTDTLHYARQLY